MTTLIGSGIEETVSGIVWDSDDGALVGIDGIKAGPEVLYGNQITLGAANITIEGFTYPSGIVYNSTNHTFYFTQQGVVYETSKTMKTATVYASTGLTKPSCLAIDPSGNLYVFDVDHIDEITSGGTVHQLTAPGSFPQQPLQGSPGLAYDTADNELYFSDPVSNVVWQITTGGSISVFAGECFAPLDGGTGCVGGRIAGTGTNVLFGVLSGIAYDSQDNVLLVADDAGALWQLSPSAQATVVAGYGPAAVIDGNGLQAFLEGPQAVAFAPSAGLLYFTGLLSGPTLDLRTYATSGIAPPAWSPPTARYPLSDPRYITEDPSVASDGSVWFLQLTGVASTTVYVDHETESGVLSSYAMPSGYTVNAPSDGRSVVDSQGNFWFMVGDGYLNSGVLECTPSGSFTYYRITTLQPNVTDGGVADIIGGPDGHVWFAQGGYYGTSIGEIAGGVISQYWVINNGGVENVLTPDTWPIVTGPDGNIWYAAYASGSAVFGRMTTSGTLLSPVSIPQGGVGFPTPDSSHDIWYFCDSDLQGTSAVCELNATSYDVSSFSMGPNENCTPTGLAVAPNGIAWLPSCDSETITSIDQSGSYMLYTMPSPQIAANGAGVAPDGNVWSTSSSGAVYLLNPTLYASAGLPVFTPDLARRRSTFVVRR